MTLTNVFMCVAMVFMAFGTIILSVIASKLNDILSDLHSIDRNIDHLLSDTNCMKWLVKDIRDYTQNIHDDCCLEEVGLITDTEDEENEEVKTINADDLIAELDRIADRIDEIDEEDEEDEIDIHLITAEQYHFGNGYSKNELKYFSNTDQVVCNIDSYTRLVIENIPEYIGDALVFFGMNVKEPNVVYVRNHILNADFRIEKFNGKCEDYD